MLINKDKKTLITEVLRLREQVTWCGSHVNNARTPHITNNKPYSTTNSEHHSDPSLETRSTNYHLILTYLILIKAFQMRVLADEDSAPSFCGAANISSHLISCHRRDKRSPAMSRWTNTQLEELTWARVINKTKWTTIQGLAMSAPHCYSGKSNKDELGGALSHGANSPGG